MSHTPVIAFFDVDETLIRTKSMLAFLRFLGRCGMVAGADEILEQLRRLSAQGTDRAGINRLYWRSYRGLAAHAVRGAAHRWFEQECTVRRDFFIASTVNKLREHRQANHRIAFASGSGLDLLHPLAELLKADFVLATRLQEENGHYTGEVASPIVIGAGKAASAADLAVRLRARPGHCFAYGDHISDLPLLEFVGHPCVVGEQGPLADHARQHGWPILPAHAAA